MQSTELTYKHNGGSEISGYPPPKLQVECYLKNNTGNLHGGFRLLLDTMTFFYAGLLYCE